MAFSIIENNTNYGIPLNGDAHNIQLQYRPTVGNLPPFIYAGVVNDSGAIVSGELNLSNLSYRLDPASASSWVSFEFKNLDSTKTYAEIYFNALENTTGSERKCKLYLRYNNNETSWYINISQTSKDTEQPSDMEYMCLIYGTGLQDAYAFATKVENVTDIQNMSQWAEAMVGVEEGNTENAYYSLPLFSDGSMTVNTDGGDQKEVRSGTTIYIYVWQQGFIKYAGSDQVGPKTKATAKKLYPSNV